MMTDRTIKNEEKYEIFSAIDILRGSKYNNISSITGSIDAT